MGSKGDESYAETTRLISCGEQFPVAYCSHDRGDEYEGFKTLDKSLSLSFTEDETSDGTNDTRSGGHRVGATVSQTSLNMAKTCMGSGTLALPFAASQGGYLFSTIGLAGVSLWNLYCVDRLLKCADLLPLEDDDIDDMSTGNEHNVSPFVGKGDDQEWKQEPFSLIDTIIRRLAGYKERKAVSDGGYEEIIVGIPPGTSKFGRVVWHAFGHRGLQIFDVIMMILLFGIIIAYIDATLSFIARTPLTSGSAVLDAVCIAIILTPITCVPNIGFLNKFSAVGILSIFLVFAVIFVYGLKDGNLMSDLDSITWSSLWPVDATGIANWFGVITFSFGTVPLTYNYQESMAAPELMDRATKGGLWIVFLTYVVISNGAAILFSPAAHSFEGDVLQHLPDGWIATMIRLIMSFVVVVTTAPLIVVPCSELVEGKVGIDDECSYMWKVLVRVGVCALSTGISVLVPGFVLVISLIGCCCVALVSFTFPPLFYIILVLKKWYASHSLVKHVNVDGFYCIDGAMKEQRMGWKANTNGSLWCDVAMLVWGIFATVFSSYLTFMNVLREMS